MKVAVLAVQGAFIEHQKKLENLGHTGQQPEHICSRRLP